MEDLFNGLAIHWWISTAAQAAVCSFAHAPESTVQDGSDCVRASVFSS